VGGCSQSCPAPGGEIYSAGYGMTPAVAASPKYGWDADTYSRPIEIATLIRGPVGTHLMTRQPRGARVMRVLILCSVRAGVQGLAGRLGGVAGVAGEGVVGVEVVHVLLVVIVQRRRRRRRRHGPGTTDGRRA
jgi:hypothetical protein